MNRAKSFLERKNISLSPKKYFIEAMSSMAMGLFATLLMGTILSSLGKLVQSDFIIKCSEFAMASCGAVLGLAIAYKLEAPPLVLFSAAVVGFAGYSMGGTFQFSGVAKPVSAGPAGAFFCALVATEIGKIVSKETPIDIIVTPMITIFIGVGMAYLICYPIAWLMYIIGNFINQTTELYPALMGAIVGVVVGIVLTLPISSAALCAMIGIAGVAGGAAAAGCCAQMVGFAVISFKENKVGGLLAQGLGTSMLQMGNIVKNMWIWLPPTLAGGICGSLSAAVFSLPCVGVSAGMGTCGLVGIVGIIDALLSSGNTITMLQWIGIPFITVILPAALSILFYLPLKKVGKIKEGDMKLDL